MYDQHLLSGLARHQGFFPAIIKELADGTLLSTSMSFWKHDTSCKY